MDTWPRPALFCPTATVADRAAPPAGLDLRVRYRGMAHLSWERWKAAR